MKSGKLLRISEDRSIFIIQNEDGSFITQDGLINYRNLGSNFNPRIIQDSYTSISNGMVDVLDIAGKAKFHFPEIWLNTTAGMVHELVDKGVLQAS